MNEVWQSQAVRDAFLNFDDIDVERLLTGDVAQLRIAWRDRDILLGLALSQIDNFPKQHAEELKSLFAEIKQVCFTVTPCLRDLLDAAENGSLVNERHQRLECVVRSYREMLSLLEEVSNFDPLLAVAYAARFNS